MGPQKSRELYRVGAGGSNRRLFGSYCPPFAVGLPRSTNLWRASQGFAPVRPILGTMAHPLSAA